MKLLLTGLSHKTAGVDLREKLAVAQHTLPEALRQLQNFGATEAMILSTCNRVEIAVTTPDEAAPAAVVERFLTAWKGSASQFAGHLYSLESREAIQHMFRVAASLDSMVVGEPQILGQLREAYFAAREEGTLGGLLDKVLSGALHAAKRVRSETGIGQMAVSVSFAAVELARTIFGPLKGHSVMIIGSGKMGELAARHLHRSGATRILVTNRTWERAVETAELFHGVAVDYENFRGMLHEVDIVIASSGAPHYVLGSDDLHRAISQRKNKPIYLIDIAVPRNIDPAVRRIDNVFLKDVDDLEGVVNANISERRRQAERAEAIVADEVEHMIDRLRVEEVAPTIIGVTEQLEQIRFAEVARARRRLPDSLTPEQRQQVEAQLDASSRAIINKIAHGHITELRRNAGQPESSHVIDAIRKVFHL